MSTSKDKELWVLILEKAWAKVHGSYQRIEGGNTAEALYALTGVHVDTIFHEQVRNDAKLWARVLSAGQKDYIIATSASIRRTGNTAENFSKAGIVDAHAYSLLSAYEIEAGG